MNEAARILSLYIQLQEGKKINKTEYCNEMKRSTRTFDRDICVIRNTLHDCYSGMELVYDGVRKEYYMREVEKKEAK